MSLGCKIFNGALRYMSPYFYKYIQVGDTKFTGLSSAYTVNNIRL